MLEALVVRVERAARYVTQAIMHVAGHTWRRVRQTEVVSAGLQPQPSQVSTGR